MRQSQLFTRTRREAPKDEVAKNAMLLIRAGFVHKEMAGVYSYLPLGLRTLEKINALIRREMDKLGANEVFLSALQNAETWRQSGRWEGEAAGVWFKSKLKNDAEVGFGWTHEEPLTALMRDHLRSYRDLPRAVYQIQTKFRNEERAKSGVMRGREFLMKDLYSFHADQADLDRFYNSVIEAYRRIFDTVGIGERTYLTFASGGAFAKYSHEFQTVCEAGEDTIYVAEEKKLAINLEVSTPETLEELGVEKSGLVPATAIEVGNIFKLGTRFSEPLGLKFRDEAGAEQPVVMGSYGLGPSRLLGAIAEVLADEKGLVWPAAIAPFAVHLVELPGREAATSQAAENLYAALNARGVEVLWDDRAVGAGEKLADSDLLGLPTRVVVSDRAVTAGEFEVVNRRGGEVSRLTADALVEALSRHGHF
jgi:prolyl-tRNA synthetase